MAKQDKKKKQLKRTPPPVVTDCDKRAENRSRDKDFQQTTDAPDGVSGNWS